MSAVLLGLVLVVIVVVALVVVRRHTARATTLLVSAEPETALLSSAAALRRLGARITRYDAEGGMLEARVTSGVVRVEATAHDARTTRLSVRGDATGVIRGFRGALAG